jgi:hypothetical protein
MTAEEAAMLAERTRCEAILAHANMPQTDHVHAARIAILQGSTVEEAGVLLASAHNLGFDFTKARAAGTPA